jgi:hypothetical protein
LAELDLKVGKTSVSFSPVSHLFLLPLRMGYSTCDLAEKFVFVNAAEDRGKGLLAEVEYYETMKTLITATIIVTTPQFLNWSRSNDYLRKLSMLRMLTVCRVPNWRMPWTR